MTSPDRTLDQHLGDVPAMRLPLEEALMGMQPVPDGMTISQEFGANATAHNSGAGHSGRDYAAPAGTNVVANEAGIVRWANWSDFLPGDDSPAGWASRWYFLRGGGGIVVVIDHGGYLSTYAHLHSTDLNTGDRVVKGEVIALSGNTGTATTGPHLHFEILPKPFNWFNGYYGRTKVAPYVTQVYKPRTGNGSPNKRYSDGIDVSGYQPPDIVSRVPSDFVLVKTTEGHGWESDRWRQQLADARALGRRVGVYHYARPGANSSDAEADFFYRVVKSQNTAGLVWFLDWEESALYSYTVWAHDFMARLDHRTGKITGLYTNTAGLTGGIWDTVDKNRPLWRAYPVLAGTGYATSFALPAPPAGWVNLVMDQYSFHGRLPGYTQDLDLDVYYGGLTPWGAVDLSVTAYDAPDLALHHHPTP